MSIVDDMHKGALGPYPSGGGAADPEVLSASVSLKFLIRAGGKIDVRGDLPICAGLGGVALGPHPDARDGNRIAFVHRLYRDAAYILVAVLGIVCFEAALRISLENYWFEELGQSHRYWLSLEYRVAIFFVVSLLVGLFVGANLRVLCRPLCNCPAKRAVDHWICARGPGRISSGRRCGFRSCGSSAPCRPVWSIRCSAGISPSICWRCLSTTTLSKSSSPSFAS